MNSHTAFSPNLFHWQITQKRVHQISCPWKVFGIKRVSQLDKKITAYFWINFGVVICKKSCGKTFIDLFNECRRFLLSRQETFFCRNLKIDKTSFLGQCNVEIASRPGSCSIVVGTFQGLNFMFLGTYFVDMYVTKCSRNFSKHINFPLTNWYSIYKISYLWKQVCRATTYHNFWWNVT